MKAQFGQVLEFWTTVWLVEQEELTQKLIRGEVHGIRPCAFYSMFLVTFFSPNLRGRAEKKQNVQRKKNALAQCSRPPDRQMTHRAHCVERSHSFFLFLFFFLFPNDDKVKQLLVATERKFDFFPVAFFAGKERF